MKKPILMALLCLPFAALAAQPTVYVSGEGGVVMPENVSGSVAGYNATVSFNPGFLVGATLGAKFYNSLRLEGELAYRRAGLDKAHVSGNGIYGSGSVSGNISALSVMFNAIYDIPTNSRWVPHIGAGVGYAHARAEVEDNSDSESDFAYQAIAGIGYRINQQITLGVDYRYFVDTTDGPDINTHNIVFSIQTRF